MVSFLIRRLLLGLLTSACISVLAFAIITAPPGDFATEYARFLSQDYQIFPGTDEYRELENGLRIQFNLDRPIHVQYFKWVWRALHGDLGLSMEHDKPVQEILGRRVGMTLVLATVTIGFTWIMAIPIGIYSAARQNTIGDYTVTFVGFLGLAIPDFLFGLTLLWLIYDHYGVLMDGLNSQTYIRESWSLGKAFDMMKHLIIPAIVLGTSGTAGLIRIMRNNLLDELRRPYVVTARAKGMSEFKLILKYPVRVALNPLISGSAYILPALFSGSIIVSVVLNLPTLGPILLQALMSQDVYVASSIVMILGILTITGIFLSDILLAIVDPRVKIEGT